MRLASTVTVQTQHHTDDGEVAVTRKDDDCVTEVGCPYEAVTDLSRHMEATAEC